MAFAKLNSRAQLGIDAPEVTVEVHLSGGLPSFSIVGMPETAVRESRERVRSALLNSGFEYPQRRITVNLAPADLPKEGGRYDLAIALGILLASNQLSSKHLHQAELYAELGLDGELRPVRGIFPAALACARQQRLIVLAAANRCEAWLAGAETQLSATNLYELCQQLSQSEPALLDAPELPPQQEAPPDQDLAMVAGQMQAKRALEIAASGSHNLLFFGPPGSGKSLLASCMTGILPPLSSDERLEAAAIHSVAGLPVEPLFNGERPFRAPHHSASAAALVGGGSSPRPGEISLAHQGVIFMDELPEFSRTVLEVLREPLETGEILISRIAGSMTYPARFSLIAAMNPCPCGYFEDGTDRCNCSQAQVDRYQGRVSGPLLDRFDMRLGLSAVDPAELMNRPEGAESSARVRERVVRAQHLQLQRQGKLNSALKVGELQQILDQLPEVKQSFADIARKMRLSARSCHRVLRVARTIADLAGESQISRSHLLEALSYRQ